MVSLPGDGTSGKGVKRNVVLLLKTELRAGTQPFPPTVYVLCVKVSYNFNGMGNILHPY